MRIVCRTLPVLMLLALGPLSSVMGQLPTQFMLDVEPVYELVLNDGTPLNMTGMTQIIPLTASGPMGFVFLNDDLNDPLQTSADFADITGDFAGQLPDGTPFDLNIIQLVSGGLSNIQRSGGTFASADASFTVLFEQIVAPGTPFEVRTLGDEMTFTASVWRGPLRRGNLFYQPRLCGPVPGHGSGSAVGRRCAESVPERRSRTHGIDIHLLYAGAGARVPTG